MAKQKSPAAVPPEALKAALAVVSAAMRAEAAAERAGADPTQPTYTARARMARVLESLADRIAAAAPVGTP
jgi:hypothetical protein